MKKSEKINYKQLVVMTFCLVALAGCAVPDKPDGIDREGFAHIGDSLYAKGDLAGAADFYQRSLQRKPNDAQTHVRLGAIFEAKGNLQAASEQYEAALASDKDDKEIYKAYGRALIKQNRLSDGRDAFEAALKIDGSDAKAASGLGVALDMMGNHAAAQGVYAEALRDNSSDMSLLNNLAHSYVLSGNFNDAIKLLEPYADDSNATTAVRQNLAEAYGMAGMDADAERVARKDLRVSEVKNNLAAYKARRKQLSAVKGYYADLGHYPTRGMVDARVAYLRSDMASDIEGLIIDDSSSVTAIGGIPSFTLRVKGFVRAEKAASFCEKLKKVEQDCKVVSGD